MSLQRLSGFETVLETLRSLDEGILPRIEVVRVEHLGVLRASLHRIDEGGVDACALHECGLGCPHAVQPDEGKAMKAAAIGEV